MSMRVFLWAMTFVGGAVAGAQPLGDRAGLAFDSKLISSTTSPLEQGVIGEFHFHNQGSTSLTILKVATNCACTDTTLSAKLVGPKASGILTVKFSIGEREGLHRNTIRLYTDESTLPYVLVFDVDIRPLFLISKGALYWRPSERNVQREILIAGLDGNTVQVSAISGGDDFFATATHQIDPFTSSIAFTLNERSSASSRTARITVRVNGLRDAQREIVLRLLPDEKVVNPLTRQ